MVECTQMLYTLYDVYTATCVTADDYVYTYIYNVHLYNYTVTTVICLLYIRTFDWLDDRRGGKRLTKLPARQFIDTALTYIQKQLQDESLFPTKFGKLAGSHSSFM